MGSLLQVLCPCYSAMSSLGSQLTSWTLRSTCSWCPSWTAKQRAKTHQEQVWFPLEGEWGGRDPHWSEGRLCLVPKVLGPFLRSVCPSHGSTGRAGLGLNREVLLAFQPRMLGDREKGKALSWQAGPLILLTSTFQDPVPALSSPCSLGTGATPVSSPW